MPSCFSLSIEQCFVVALICLLFLASLLWTIKIESQQTTQFAIHVAGDPITCGGDQLKDTTTQQRLCARHEWEIFFAGTQSLDWSGYFPRLDYRELFMTLRRRWIIQVYLALYMIVSALKFKWSRLVGSLYLPASLAGRGSLSFCALSKGTEIRHISSDKQRLEHSTGLIEL